ncbi:amino acid adenylation domain-containing protein [Candidatus Poribacteria bacterium]
MDDLSGCGVELIQQKSIRARCVHPTGDFIEFRKEEIEQSIPERFEKQARIHPHKAAVRIGSDSLTYDELNKAANRVARVILAQSGNNQTPVLLLLDHSILTVAAMLGILKAGTFYVPLDPAFPRARLIYMLEDSQADLVLTNSENLSLAEEITQNSCQLVNIDDVDSNIPGDNPGIYVSPDDLAYIIYTSGSTGQPKGVMQPHRNVLHYIMTYTNAFHICAEDRLTALYSPSSFGTIRSVFGALLNGATTFPFDIRKRGLTRMADWLAREEITLYHSVATVFRHFVGSLTGEEQFPRLRVIRLGGEPVYKRDVELYKKHFSEDCILVNGLSSTETGSMRKYFIDKETIITDARVPVGYPVENKEVLLLGDDGGKVGHKRYGEIAVKSRYTATGYWRKQEITRKAFLPDPEGGNERIYRTGDLGRMFPDGRLVHMGRSDFQIKIRGYRIEPAEIEMALLDLCEIKEAVVLAVDNLSDDQRLVAYIVPSGQSIPTATQLRRELAQKLPDYMIPSAFVIMDSLPLVANGKVNLQALPAPGTERPELDTPFAAPRTPAEMEVAGIWSDVLGLDEVGIHDSFFDLGGHSLLATQIISRVIDMFQVVVPMRSLFQSPTVADMAMIIGQNQTSKAERGGVNRILAELETLLDEQVKRLPADEEDGGDGDRDIS